MRSVLSTTTRSGWRRRGARDRRSPSLTVSWGSSRRTVPIPTMTASTWLRRRCACRRAASPVIHRDSPLAAAHPVTIDFVQPLGFLAKTADGHLDARTAQATDAAPADQRVGIAYRYHD